ncbi:hypothetical protein HPP92_023935 [Vanilla planifolia]|uniref:Bifunctional inhibitor/plant lipid transfer protein/seed storage helical domain-containing protein n=1 Tax=Vanilla planifolia TaxID=51239 RepID=A0A835PU47_VANPL|nr:hypothetical protein HPP92_023935 [Vanilla planifolia]
MAAIASSYLLSASQMLILLVFSFTVVASTLSASGGDGGGAGKDLPCMKQLLPCQPYLHVPNPPKQCCGPLVSAVENDAACLCTVFYSETILKALNLTKKEALQLPRNCGASVDLDKCKEGDVPAPPTSSPSAPAKPSPPSNDSSGSVASVGKSMTPASLSFVFGGLASVAALLLN